MRGCSSTGKRGGVSIVAALLLLAGVIGASATTPTDMRAGVATVTHRTTIEQYGIRWQFAEAAPIGQFANGDYWIVGPVTIVAVEPAFDGVANGWEVNPRVSGPQGFCAALGSFDAALVPPLPYRARPNESLVKTVCSSRHPVGRNCRGCLQVAAVLSVVDAIPPDSGASVFRPPYVATWKPRYSTTHLRVDLLPALPRVPQAPPPVWVERAFAKVQLDHKQGRLGRNLHPVENIPDYGADIARRNGDAALCLMLDDGLGTKFRGLVRYLQYGIDLYAMVRDGHRWSAGGGHRPGQKLPLAFAAVLLNDDSMRQMVTHATFFHEDNVIYRGSHTHIALYGDSKGFADSVLERRYWHALYTQVREGKARGYKAYRDPYGLIDGGVEPGGAYQFCCTSQPWKGEALACHLMPSLKALWPFPAFYEYVDRWVALGAWTQPDTCAPPVGSWEQYGERFGPDGNGGCIRDTDSTDGIGRFPALHGVNPDGGARRSRFQGAMWDAYRSAASPTLTPTNEGR